MAKAIETGTGKGEREIWRAAPSDCFQLGCEDWEIEA